MQPIYLFSKCPTKMNKLESQMYRGRKKFVQNCNSLAKLFEMEGYFGRVTFDKASESWNATHWRPSTWLLKIRLGSLYDCRIIIFRNVSQNVGVFIRCEILINWKALFPLVEALKSRTHIRYVVKSVYSCFPN